MDWGAATVVDSVIIDWVDGSRQVLYNVAADQLLEVSTIDASFDFGEWSVSPNPFSSFTLFQGKTANGGKPSIQLFAENGRLITELTEPDLYPDNGWSLRWRASGKEKHLPAGVYYADFLWLMRRLGRRSC